MKLGSEISCIGGVDNQSRVRVKILVRTISCGASDAVIRNSFEEISELIQLSYLSIRL